MYSKVNICINFFHFLHPKVILKEKTGKEAELQLSKSAN